MNNFATGGLVSPVGTGGIPWAEPEPIGCEYLIPIGNANRVHNLAVLAEAQRQLNTPEA